MIELPVTSDDRAEASRVGNAKVDYSIRNNFRDYGDGFAQRRDNNIVGSLGELMCARFFGVPFDTSENAFDKVDCKIFEVRARDITSGRDLAIRPHDKMRLPHVLVWINDKRTSATIVGWLVGWEGHQRAMQAKAEAGRDVWWQQRKGTWFIPPPYHSVQSLQDWITAGHPLHWAPEEYREVQP